MATNNIKKAYELGQKAAKEGKGQIPVNDPKIQDMIQGLQVGEGASEIFKSWLKGWHKEIDEFIFNSSN